MIAEDVQVDSIRSGRDNKMVKKSLFSFENLYGAAKYLTLDAKLAFTKLKKAFTIAPILQYFDPKYNIWIETDMSDYIIGEILRQLTLDNLA